MSLFNKNIDEMTFDDIKSFIEQGNNERVILEYKKEWPSNDKMAKEMSSFANTYGGLILVGVDEPRNGKPCEIIGVNNNESWNEKITSIALKSIEPPIIPQIATIPIPQTDRVIVIIRISESVHAPHTIENRTKIYYRINKQSEPVQNASLDKILWLNERRNKAVTIKNSLLNRCDERSNNLFDKNWVVKTIYTVPSYPIEEMLTLGELKESLNKSNLATLIQSIDNTKVSANESIIHYASNDVYMEINSSGLIYRKDLFTKNVNNATPTGIDTWDIIVDIMKFIIKSMQFYKIIGYWGPISIGYKLVNIKHLYLMKPERQQDDSKYHLPRFDAEININDVIIHCIDGKSINEFIEKLYNKYCWAFNYGLNTPDKEVNIKITNTLKRDYNCSTFEEIIQRAKR